MDKIVNGEWRNFVNFPSINFLRFFTFTVEEPASQTAQATALITEILALLNNCNPRPDVMNVIVTSYQDWMSSSPDSILLLPSIGAACRTIASVVHLVQIVHTSVHACFSSTGGEFPIDS